MQAKWVRALAIVAVGVAAAVVVALVGRALGGGGSPSTKTTYQTDVVKARDRVDYVLFRITKSRSPDELVARFDEASTTVDDVANGLGNVSAPKGLGAENARLVRTLHSFSTTLSGTADSLRDPSTRGAILSGLNGVSFPEWVEINHILADLRSRGIDVEPLARH